MSLKRLVYVVIATALFVLAVPVVAGANSMYLGESGFPLEAQSTNDIALERQVMQVWLRQGFAEVETVYQFYNAGEAQTFNMGLPEAITSKEKLKYGVYNFKAYVDGNPVEARTAKTNAEKIGSVSGTINWHRHAVFIAEGERRIVVHRYWVRISPFERKLTIDLEPGASWKGAIDRADYIVHLTGSLKERNIVYPKGFGPFTGKYAVQPVGFTPGENQLRWTLDNFEPSGELEIEIFSDVKKTVAGAKASGVHAESKTKKFPPELAFDQDISTAWAYGGPGNKEWLLASFGDKKKWVREFRIIPGYGQLEGMYRYYNRPHHITLSFSDGSKQRFELKDALEMQTFKIEPVQTKYVKIDVDSVYKGIYPDVTYISEVEFGDVASPAKIEPAKWEVGLPQIEKIESGSKYSTFDLITIAATAAVFLLITWQIIVAIRNRRKKNAA